MNSYRGRSFQTLHRAAQQCSDDGPSDDEEDGGPDHNQLRRFFLDDKIVKSYRGRSFQTHHRAAHQWIDSSSDSDSDDESSDDEEDCGPNHNQLRRFCLDDQRHHQATSQPRADCQLSIARRQTTSNLFVNTEATTTNNTKQSFPSQNDGVIPPTTDKPLSPWNNKCSAKKRIIQELKNETSSIHLLGVTGIYEEYAHQYDRKKSMTNLNYLMNQFNKKEGPFSEKNDKKGEASKGDDYIEPWYERSKPSKAYTMLYQLYMDKTTEYTYDMEAKDIWELHHQFMRYPLNDFKKYNTNMKRLAAKKKLIIDEDELAFQKDCIYFVSKTITNRGYPFWHKHAASELLKEDAENGITTQMKPADLWASRSEYMDFPLEVFRKHIYQEKYKQLAKPYWQYFRNRMSGKLHELEASKLKEEWQQRHANEGMNLVFEEWKNFNIGDD